MEAMNLLKFWIILLFEIYAAKSTRAARILLIYPYFSKSHEAFHNGIAKSLLAVGHHVTAVTSFPKTVAHANYTVISSARPEHSNISNVFPSDLALEMNIDSIITRIFEKSTQDCHHVIRLNDIQRILKSKEKLFDVLILDMAFKMYNCFLPVAETLNIPVIGTIALRILHNVEWNVGNPFNPAVFPHEISKFSIPLTFRQRLSNTYDCLSDMANLKYVYKPEIQSLLRKYFPNMLSVLYTKKPVLLFVNSHPVLTPRPLLPNVINIGGIHVQPTKPLPSDLQTFIDDAELGVILFSFGSFLQSHALPSITISVLRKVFAQVPQRVIWKAEEKIDGLSANVLLSSWLPQRDILAHKNVVAFMSHCGISGMYEALHSGTPMVLLPMFVDQTSNALLLSQLGVGVYVDVKTLSEEKLLSALEDVINGTKYRLRMKEISSLMKDQPLKPQETVVFWTEYTLRHDGAKHIESVASDTPLYQYLLLDVVACIFLVTLSVSVAFYYLCKSIYYVSCRINVPVTKKTD